MVLSAVLLAILLHALFTKLLAVSQFGDTTIIF